MGGEGTTEKILRWGSEQCRLNHGPNGPLARAPKLLGPPD